MKDDLQLLKREMNTLDKAENIWNNPCVRLLLEVVSAYVPVLPGMIDSSIQSLIGKRQKEKLEELLTLVFSDSSITRADLEDVDNIMKIAKVIDAVNRLIGNEKIQYFARLLKNNLKEEDKDNDLFEEQLEKLKSLSIREIELLYDLYTEEEKNMSLDSSDEKVFNPITSWENFLTKAKEKTGYDETTISSLMLGIMRTGFCMCEWKFGFSSSKLVMYTTPEYHKLLKRIS